ncbi:MAG: acetyl-CoA carboxylase carboxyl transferase subunit alpha, partial [Bacteroidia bacterium]
MNYLDFEKPIAELNEQLEKVKQVAEKSGVDASKMAAEIEEKIKQTQ